jgi:hypothetical protein
MADVIPSTTNLMVVEQMESGNLDSFVTMMGRNI